MVRPPISWPGKLFRRGPMRGNWRHWGWMRGPCWMGRCKLICAMKPGAMGNPVWRCALIYAPRASSTLHDALEDRFRTGDDDLTVATRHNVHRSVLCRARRWILSSITSEAVSPQL